MRQQAIVFDLDGTAVDSPERKLPSNQLINIIDQLKVKYFFCAATGRVWSFAKPVLEGLHLVDPSIISSGTQICNPVTGKILWQKVLEEEALRKVIALFKQNPEYKLLYNDGTEDDYFHGGLYPKDFIAKEPVYFLEQVFVPGKIAQKIYLKLNDVEGVTCVMVVAQKPGCRDLHIVNSSATKEHSIAELLKLLGVTRENAIGIGDGHNDIHLFNAVDYKVAMGNAVPELKQMADKVIGSVKNDGMVEYLRSLI